MAVRPSDGSGEPRNEEEANTIVITKKVSQADKKKALKAKKREGEAKDEDN